MIGSEAAGEGPAVGGLLDQDTEMVPALEEAEVCGDGSVVEQDFEDFFGCLQIDDRDVGFCEQVVEGTGTGYPEVEPGLVGFGSGLEVTEIGGEVAVGLEDGCGGVCVCAEVG